MVPPALASARPKVWGPTQLLWHHRAFCVAALALDICMACAGGTRVMPSLLVWTGLPPASELAGGGHHAPIYACRFQLFLLPYIQLFQDGQDLIIMHTKMKWEMCPMSSPVFAIHREERGRLEKSRIWLARVQPWWRGTEGRRQQGEGEREDAVGTSTNRSTPGRNTLGLQRRRGGCNVLESGKARLWDRSTGFARKTNVENQNEARKERLCRGHLPALTKRQLLFPACSGSTGDDLAESNTSLGRERHPGKGILPSISIKQGGTG